jgi:hypothetical protein
MITSVAAVCHNFCSNIVGKRYALLLVGRLIVLVLVWRIAVDSKGIPIHCKAFTNR